MPDITSTTQQNILDAGRKEFLAKGFRAASLRNIVKRAGVTTGAFYGYYKSKEALFDALVSKPYHVFMEQFIKAQNSFASLPPEEQPGNMGSISGKCMDWMVGYIYEHFEAFKLLLCCAEGTRYERMIHELSQIEVDATHRFLSVLQNLGYCVRKIDPQLEHILVSSLFSGFFEMVIHDMPQAQAVVYVNELREFYTAGWQKIMGL